MATYQSGGVRKATANSRKAAARSAESRRCPTCDRKSALVFHSDDVGFGFECRWDDCDYSNVRPRDAGGASSVSPDQTTTNH